MVRKNVSYSLTHVDYTLSTAVTQIEIKRYVHSLPKTSAYGLKQQKLWLLVPPSPFLYTSVFNSEQRKQQLISLTLFCQNTVFLKPKCRVRVSCFSICASYCRCLESSFSSKMDSLKESFFAQFFVILARRLCFIFVYYVEDHDTIVRTDLPKYD